MDKIIFLSVFGSAALLAYFIIEALIPLMIDSYSKMHAERASRFERKLEDAFLFWEKKHVILISFSPFIFAGVAFVLFRNILAPALGFCLGFGFPNLVLKLAKEQRIKKFRSQMVDSLMLLSSSLKAGLSLIQAIEVLCTEMPAPISQEFRLVLNENKWGVSLEESLKRLRQRMPLEEINLLVSSVLIGRESGGELTRVFSRLVETIRNNVKLKEKVATLTLQGRLQGLIMMFLPFGFTYFVYKQNPNHFDIMLQNELGRTLVITAIGLQIVGMFMIRKISTVKL
jgi:tight adherence protein B